jgi:hypothetical protein
MSDAASSAPEASVELESPEAAARRGARDAYLFGKPPENLPSHGDPAPRRVTPARDVTIERLDFSKKRDRARFIDCAARFYVGEPHYIAPLRMQLEKFLDPKKNPAYENLEVQPFVAVRRGEIVGRITAHYDRAYAAYHEVKTASSASSSASTTLASPTRSSTRPWPGARRVARSRSSAR